MIYMNVMMIQNRFFLVLFDYSKVFDYANHHLIHAKLMAAGFCDDSLAWIPL